MEEKKLSKDKIKSQGKGLLNEFKAFISKGNIVDLAIAVIIGNAFGKIVTSLVDNLLMPLVGIIIGGQNFSQLSIKIGGAVIAYGLFIQSVVDFLIIAACIFVMVKIISIFSKKEEKVEEPKKDPQLEVLEEIRDLLKENK